MTMLHNDIYELHLRHSNPDGSVTRHPAGRFMVSKGQLHHLEDYHGLLHQWLPEGPVGNMQHAVFQALKRSPYLDVVSRNDVLQGDHLDEIPEAEIPDPPEPHEIDSRPSSVFEYHRAGMDHPHIVEVKGNRITLDGNELSEDEARQISHNVQSGAATFRYRKRASGEIRKMEVALAFLKKADEMDSRAAFGHLDEAVRGGHLDPRVVDAFRKLVFEDKMVSGVGNKYAYQQWRDQPRPGIHVLLDGNDFGSINKVHGQSAGDQAIRAFGSTIRSAMDEVMDEGKRGKVFHTPEEYNVHRDGGDEFRCHLPTHEHAARFVRVLREKLDQIPPIGGTHRLSMSIGLGHDPLSAEGALIQAKEAKRNHMAMKGLQAGQAPHFAHSLVPGAEGPVPTVDPHPMNVPGMEQRPVTPPKL